MRKWKMFYLAIVASMVHVLAQAQSAVVDSADAGGVMRSNGKIYVVVAILLTILAGLIFYVARLDKKIGRLEKDA
jgi:MFS superfamily sulfate permease-like transporter